MILLIVVFVFVKILFICLFVVVNVFVEFKVWKCEIVCICVLKLVGWVGWCVNIVWIIFIVIFLFWYYVWKWLSMKFIILVIIFWFVSLLLKSVVDFFIKFFKLSGKFFLIIICNVFNVVWCNVNGFALFFGVWLILKIFVRVLNLFVKVIVFVMSDLGNLFFVKCGIYCLFNVIVIFLFLLLWWV